MKNVKRIASLVLALVMVFSLATTAFASGDVTPTTGKITVTNPVEGESYSVYQILDLESYEKDKAYSYKATEAWKVFVESDAIKDTYLKTDKDGYVTEGTNFDAAAFAKLALAYAETNNIEATAGPTEATGDTVVFTGLDLGYYLLDSTLGTLCSLDTTDADVEVEEKNEEPGNVKTVEEDSTQTYGPANDADVGQVVNFKSTITAYEGAINYVLHDTMSAGLTYIEVTGVTLNGDAVAAANYSVVSSANHTDDKGTEDTEDDTTVTHTFDVVFTQAFCDTLKDEDKIVVSYTAKVNQNAVVGVGGNPNDSQLSYGDGATVTEESRTTTYTWDVDVFKYTTVNGAKVALSGATFKVNKDGKDTTAGFNFHDVTPADYNADAPADKMKTYELCVDIACTGTHVTEITTDKTGKFKLEGLDADIYYLVETAAPAGYNKLSGPVQFKVEPTIDATTGTATYTTPLVEVENKSGNELPSTGGMGTTMFYIVGGAMVLAAVVFLVTKKRMNVAE